MSLLCAGIKCWAHVGVGLCSVARAVVVGQLGWVQDYVQAVFSLSQLIPTPDKLNLPDQGGPTGCLASHY